MTELTTIEEPEGTERKRPIPDHAVRVWFDMSGHLMCEHTGPDGDSSSVWLPPTEAGLRALREVCRLRAYEGVERIGHPGSPTQVEASALVAAFQKSLRREAPRRPEPVDLDLEIDLDF